MEELVDKHGDNYTEAQLRVWGRLIVNGLHSNTDTPPNIPIITGEPAVKKRKEVVPKQDESFTDVLKSAVSVFAERFTPITLTHHWQLLLPLQLRLVFLQPAKLNCRLSILAN